MAKKTTSLTKENVKERVSGWSNAQLLSKINLFQPPFVQEAVKAEISRRKAAGTMTKPDKLRGFRRQEEPKPKPIRLSQRTKTKREDGPTSRQDYYKRKEEEDTEKEIQEAYDKTYRKEKARKKVKKIKIVPIKRRKQKQKKKDPISYFIGISKPRKKHKKTKEVKWL